MKTSAKQLERLKTIEGFKPRAYRDGSANGVPKYSIGYGHQIQPNEQYLMTATISPATAQQQLENFIKPLEDQLNKAKYKFNQNQFDAMISFGYNTPAGMASALAVWNSTKDITKVTAKMAEYTKSHANPSNTLLPDATLEARRLAEIKLFKTPALPMIAVAVACAAALYALSS